MLLGTLVASLLGTMLTSKGIVQASQRKHYSWSEFLMPPNQSTNFEIQKH